MEPQLPFDPNTDTRADILQLYHDLQQYHIAPVERERNVNARGRHGRTMLFHALDLKRVIDLLSDGADVTIQDYEGKIALDYMRENGFLIITERIRRRKRQRHLLPPRCQFMEHMSMVDTIIKHSASTRFDQNRLLLHRSILQKLSTPYTWKSVEKIVTANLQAVVEKDPVVELYPFQLAAVGHESDLNSIYELLRRAPDLL